MSKVGSAEPLFYLRPGGYHLYVLLTHFLGLREWNLGFSLSVIVIRVSIFAPYVYVRLLSTRTSASVYNFITMT